jgi:hypothetical protein
MTTSNNITSTIGTGTCNAIRGGWKEFRKVMVLGKFHLIAKRDVEFQLISDVGRMQITSVGNENLYFNFETDDGEVLPGYCKCL